MEFIDNWLHLCKWLGIFVNLPLNVSYDTWSKFTFLKKQAIQNMANEMQKFTETPRKDQNYVNWSWM